MNEDIIKNYILNNGLKLEFIDQSKEIYTGLFYVCILIRIVVLVEKKWFKNEPIDEVKFTQITNTLKEQIVFEQKHEHHFIKASLKNESKDLIISSILGSSVQYLGHINFPKKLILQRFCEKTNSF